MPRVHFQSVHVSRAGAISLLDAFQPNRQGGCGDALPDFGFSSANIVQPSGSASGVADDLNSVIVYDDPSAIGAAAQEALTKVPLCEDM